MKKLAAAFFLSLCCAEAQAQVSAQDQQNITAIQDQVVQRQNQMEQERVKERDIQKTIKDRKGLEKEELEEFDELEAEVGKVVQNYRRIQCFHIDEITFSKNSLVPREREIGFTKPYLNKCLNSEQISELAQDVTDYLVVQGYVTSKAEIPTQSLYSGTLKVNVIESHLENILFNDEKFSDKTQKFTAFGFYPTKEILNIRPLEIGIDQINRLSSNNATIKFIPAKEKNDVIALIENTPKNRSHLSLSYDNNGNKKTGDRRNTIGFAQDNLFWLNDIFSISRTANDFDQARKKNGGTAAINANFSVPFYLYTLNVSYTDSSYFFWNNNSSQHIRSSGETKTSTVNLERLMIKSKKTKITSGISLIKRENENLINDVRVETSSRKASIVTLNFMQTFFLDNATIFYKPSFSKSFGVLNARSDASNTPNASPHAEFDIFRFYGNYTQKFLVKNLQFSYNLALDSQLAKQHLYSIDKFSIGGVYSVRGFKNGTISGDSGFSIRNELTFGVSRFWSDSKLPLQYFSLTPFYDLGYVENVGVNRSGRLSGGGLRVNLNYKDYRSNLTFSRSISKSRLLQAQTYQDDVAIFFNIASNLNF